MTRQVRIGTQAFARPTQWFGLDDCEMTSEGLLTPAVEQIVTARRTPPPRRAPRGQPDLEAAGSPAVGRQRPAARLEAAVQSGSVEAVTSLCRELEAEIRGGARDTAGAAAVKEARVWLEQQAEQRRELFRELEQAVEGRKASRVRTLLARAEAMVGPGRSREEDAALLAAGTFLEMQKRTAGWEHRDTAPPVRGPKFFTIPPSGARSSSRSSGAHPRPAGPTPAQAAAHRRMRERLSELRSGGHRLPWREVNRLGRLRHRSAPAQAAHPGP